MADDPACPETARSPFWITAEAAADAVREAGTAVGLPFIAAQSNLADPEPMRGAGGRPYAQTHFCWIDPGYSYWLDRRLALESPILKAARLISEPFYLADGCLRTWRPTAWLDGIDLAYLREAGGDYGAIVCPVHLPRGVIGAVVWAGRGVDVAEIFHREAARLFVLAVTFISAHAEAAGAVPGAGADPSLTRREAQCLKWAAAGKTDAEIGIILALSVSTVRFHLRNAAAKLRAGGRAHAIQLASSLGYVGAR
jgi:DNA-binding CsgD family transcriptional regulator